MKQGTRANYTGNRLEQFVETTLSSLGYTFIDKKKFKAAKYLEQPIYTKQYFLGTNIYNTKIYCDFVLYHPNKHPECLVIECKWQQSGGSVDEKYPYLILNIQHKYPHKTMLVLDGGGYKKGAENWMRSQVGNNLLAVMNMSEFQTYANKDKI